MTIDQLISEVERAMEGASPGPWHYYSNENSPASTLTGGLAAAMLTGPRQRLMGKANAFTPEDAAYISAVNPANMRLILDALKSEREARGKAEAASEQYRLYAAEKSNQYIAAQARFKEVEAERDDLLNEVSSFRSSFREQIETKARLMEAEKVIEPFAKEASCWRNLPGSIISDNVELWQNLGHRTRMTVGDLRAAAAFLNAREADNADK